MRELHLNFAWVVVATNAIAGLWAGAAHWVEPLRHRALWIFTILAQLTVFVQVIFGVWMVAQQGLVAPEFHEFYGFVTLIAVMILYGYRQQVPQYLYLLYGGGGLFLMGLGLRAIYLNTPVA